MRICTSLATDADRSPHLQMPCRPRHRSHAGWGLLLLFTALAPSAFAAPRFQLSGSGSLKVETPSQTAGNFQIRATLEETNAISGAPSMRQEGNHFSLSATLATAAVACYNDTIFRDDFDGDGL